MHLKKYYNYHYDMVKKNIIYRNQAKFIRLVYNWQLLWLMNYFEISQKLTDFQNSILMGVNFKKKYKNFVIKNSGNKSEKDRISLNNII